jgi:hypothetical protein
VPCTGTGTHELGFVADPDMDGWTVGAPPFFGDYFLPGLPFEGWSIQIDTATRCDAFNGNVSGLGFTGSLTGTNISYSSTGATSTGLWQGSLDSLAITQETSIDTGALFFTVKITLVNTSHTALNNIYYWKYRHFSCKRKRYSLRQRLPCTWYNGYKCTLFHCQWLATAFYY